MKKMIFTLALVVCMVSAMNAQNSKQAIGIRFGYGAELSYQNSLSKANRIELDLGLNYGGVGLSGIYQWVWNLPSISNNLNWYAGAGANLGLYSSSVGIGILGQIGAEYHFDKVPIMLSLDYRPGIYVLPSVGGSYDGICLAVRYKF